MKKLLSLLITISMLLSTSAMVSANDDIKVVLDGERIIFDVPPQIIDGRTMVPVRAIFEKLGAEVDWDAELSAVYAYMPGVFIQLVIGDTNAYRNSVQQTIDVPAQIINDRTLVPLRVVSEYMGAIVEWNQDTKTVYITSTNNIQYIDWNDNFTYCGEVTNGRANGYGMLLSKSDESIAQLGKYSNSLILEGTDYFDNGDCYVGTYINGNFSSGTYYYNDGKLYIGEFSDSKKSGHGVMHYTDGNYLDGYWENDVPHGQCTFYIADEDVYMSGNYTNGKRNGMFSLYDPYTNLTITQEFKNDILYNDAAKYREQLDEYYKRQNEVHAKMEEIYQKRIELKEWYDEESEKLLDYILNGDPYSTDWAKSIYEQYGLTGSGKGLASNDTSISNNKNLDSYAAANALRQSLALYNSLKSQADAAILEYNQTYIENQQKLIEDKYSYETASLDSMTATLELELKQLEIEYSHLINGYDM